MAEQLPSGKNAYITLLTRPSYLAGALLLAYTLHKHSPSTPLIICFTPSTLPESCIAAFRSEAKYSNIILRPVEHLTLPDDGDGTEAGMVAERFVDTWTKLRVFDVCEWGDWERVCWLDADMLVFSDPSPLIFNAANDEYLRGGDGNRLMAVHTCVCNLDNDAWAPKDWIPANCALSRLSSPSSIALVEPEPPTLSNFNSGTFLYRPTPSLASFVRQTFASTPTQTLRAMQFPDQDFLNLAFSGSWSPLSWRTNALKTWRYWHTNIWSDSLVSILHYIVDKPWAARVGEDGAAGYAGKDGETHGWWWGEFEGWEKDRIEKGEGKLVEEVGRYVASETGEVSEEMSAIGGGAQEWGKRMKSEEAKKDGKNEEGKEEDGDLGQGPHGPILRQKFAGERGHGPVVRGIGRGRGRGEGWSVMEN